MLNLIFSEEEIQQSIAQHNLHQWLSSINPRHKRFLKLIEEEKQIENQISFCTDVLKMNALNNILDKVEQKINDMVYND